MRSIYSIVIICLIVSCNSINDNKNIETIKVIKEVNAEPSGFTASTKPIIKTIELPELGIFELIDMTIDSLNEYGAGDCWGTIRRFSSPEKGLAIDSMTCSEYGFTYRYYLLTGKDVILAVYTKKSESILDPETNSYFYVQEEQVIDFNSDPASSMTKIDTISDYTLRENPIEKKYLTEPLKDKQTTYENFEMEYQGTWELELNY